MLKLHTDVDWWGIEQLTDIKGTEFPAVLVFASSNGDKFIVPMPSNNNKLWQVEKDEFIVQSGPELIHIRLSRTEGVKFLFRAPAEKAKSMFKNTFFCCESATEKYIYSVIDRLTIKDIFENLIDPMISVTVEIQPLSIRIDAPYLTARFSLMGPIDDASMLRVSDCIIDTGRSPGTPLLCVSFRDCTTSWVRSFEQFLKLAKARCEEIRMAEYYEKCGGYLIKGKLTKGIFRLKEYANGETYEFSPDEYFGDVAIPRLLSENGLMEVKPQQKCCFVGNGIETQEYSIALSRDVLIIVEHTNDGDKRYALEMYEETCLGIRQIGKQVFLAILAKNPTVPVAKLKRFSKQGSDKYAWDDLDPLCGGDSYVYPLFSQLDDDVILYEKMPNDHSGCHNYEMWSIAKDQPANLTNSLYNICSSNLKGNLSICHMEKQILVKPAGEKNKDKEARILIAIRIYWPKEHCDVFALLDPTKKYRVYGKAYNMLADSVTKKPKTLSALVKLLKENSALKQKIEYFL